MKTVFNYFNCYGHNTDRKENKIFLIYKESDGDFLPPHL
jgi:hypothetical protein